MRYFVPLVFIVLAALYFTLGLRAGYLTLTKTYMYNANGTNTYSYQATDDQQRLGVTGSCEVSGGQATVTLLDPSGTQIAGQTCQKGKWSLNVMGGGKVGLYKVVVNFKKFNGTMELNETHAGGTF